MKELAAAGAKFLQVEDLGAWLPLFTRNNDDFKWIVDVIRQCVDGVDAKIVWRAVCTGTAATGAWVVGRVTGPPARARTVGLAALVGTQLGQTLAAGRPSPATVASVVGSGALLVVVIQTPGISQLFGCTPLDPLGWVTAAVASAAGTGAALVLPRLWEHRTRSELAPA